MKKETYMKPAIKKADIEAEQLLTTSMDINKEGTNDQWSKSFDDDTDGISVWE